MKLPPAYRFPTTAVFLDDDMDFITVLNDSLESENFILKKFDDPKKTLSFLSNNSPKDTKDTWTKIYDSDNDFHSVSIEVNFANICTILNNPDRFNQITTIIVDYKMPHLDGLTFLNLIKNVQAKKTLLTGVADANVAVDAIEKGLIDSYFAKHDPDLLQKVAKTLNNNQEAYFEEQSKLIKFALKLCQHQDDRLNPSYCRIFNRIKKQHKAVEHYFLDENGSCMFINQNSERAELIIKSVEQINSDSEQGHVAMTTNTAKRSPLFDGSEYYYSIRMPSHL